MNADGTNSRQLTRVGVKGHFMRWSVDGRAVAFRCQCGSTSHFSEVPLTGGEPVALPDDMAGGAHLSFNPDHSRIMDVVGHKTLWASPLRDGKPIKVFAFDDPDVRIDYPVWSPDGKWVLFDHFRPEGGDIWVLQGIE
jgi:Tol biopolymer transport system component